jgi:quercetin dioxygenase-like cupin family protein
MLIKKISDVPVTPVKSGDAQKAAVRVLFGPKDGAPTFAMRQFELEPGGFTPHHNHPFEHQILVMQGQMVAVSENGDIPVGVGDVLMIMPGEKHQFRNDSAQPAKFLCMVPVEYQK